jgi:probable rRNA maturation factor
MACQVFLENVTLPEGVPDPEKLRQAGDAILQHSGKEGRSCVLVFCDRETIREINRDFRGIDSVTDVISFAEQDMPVPGPEEEREDLGEVYICLDRALEQAPEYGNDAKGEIMRLMVHGILHLQGYDHEAGGEPARIMEKKEEEILSLLD